MGKFRKYDVSFSGLKLGSHEFEFNITQSFFDLFEFNQDFAHPDLKVCLNLDKKNNFLELNFILSGTVELICDVSNESYHQELKGSQEVIVKFGDDYDFSDDEVWMVPHGEHAINVAQLIYEMCLLAVPVKRIHPDVISGESHSEMIELLEKYSPHEIEENSDEDEIDPRWEALKKLKK